MVEIKMTHTQHMFLFLLCYFS